MPAIRMATTSRDVIPITHHNPIMTAVVLRRVEHPSVRDPAVPSWLATNTTKLNTCINMSPEARNQFISHLSGSNRIIIPVSAEFIMQMNAYDVYFAKIVRRRACINLIREFRTQLFGSMRASAVTDEQGCESLGMFAQHRLDAMVTDYYRCIPSSW